MPMTIRPPSKRVERRAQASRGLGRVEVVRLGVEVLDRLGHDARAGRQDEVVVAERADRRPGCTTWRRLVDPRRPRRRRASRACRAAPRSGRWRLRGPLAAHGDVHEAGLVDVLAGLSTTMISTSPRSIRRRSLRTRRLAVRVPPTPPPRMRIRCMASLPELLDDDLVVAVAGLERDQAVAGLLDPLRDVGLASPCPRSRRR